MIFFLAELLLCIQPVECSFCGVSALVKVCFCQKKKKINVFRCDLIKFWVGGEDSLMKAITQLKLIHEIDKFS